MSYVSGGTTRGILRLKTPVGGTPDVSGVNEGRLFFDDSRGMFQASQNGGIYLPGMPGLTTLVFRPGDPSPAPNVFTTWTDLVAALNASVGVRGFRYVEVDDSFAPTTVPAGAHTINDPTQVIWGGRLDKQPIPVQQTELSFDDGATVNAGCFSQVTNLLQLTSNSNSPIVDLGTTSVFMGCSRGVVIQANGGAPFFSVSDPSGLLIIQMDIGTNLKNGASAVIDMAVSGAQALILMQELTVVDQNTISGVAGSFMQVQTASPSADFSPTQGAMAGAIFMAVADKYALIELSPVTPSGDYTVGYRDTVILVTTTGATATITLPDASLFPGREIVIKKVDAAVDIVTITPVGGQTIDGAATVDLTSQWEFRRIVAAAGNWYVTGQ